MPSSIENFFQDFEPMADHFCRLYGYGGFNIAKTPTFFAPRLAFLDMFDGVLAQACIRGGGYSLI